MDGSKTNITSYDHQYYNWRTVGPIDAADFYAASELGVKMKSREAIYKHFNMTWNNDEMTCKKLNEMTWDFVVEHYG